MKARGVQPTADDYNLLIKGCLKAERYRDVDEALTKMTEEDGIVANLQTYNLVLKVCVAQKDITKAEQIFGALQRQGLVPDAETYHTLIEACAVYDQARQGNLC